MRWTEEQYTEYLRKNDKLPGKGLILTPVKKSKYNNKRVKIDGILFDSQQEADYYSKLKLLLKAETIKGFCRQPEFILQEGIGEVKPITYRADFIVFRNDGTSEIIDIKGYETDGFKLKQKLFIGKFPRLELKIEKGD